MVLVPSFTKRTLVGGDLPLHLPSLFFGVLSPSVILECLLFAESLLADVALILESEVGVHFGLLSGCPLYWMLILQVFV